MHSGKKWWILLYVLLKPWLCCCLIATLAPQQKSGPAETFRALKAIAKSLTLRDYRLRSLAVFKQVERAKKAGKPQTPKARGACNCQFKLPRKHGNTKREMHGKIKRLKQYLLKPVNVGLIRGNYKCMYPDHRSPRSDPVQIQAWSVEVFSELALYIKIYFFAFWPITGLRNLVWHRSSTDYTLHAVKQVCKSMV